MKIGASLISLIRRAMRVQSSSLIRPARMSAEPDPRLGRQQPHDDLGLAHLQREHRTGHAVLDRAGPGEIQPERGVVRRNHRAAGQVEVIGGVDLDAPHGHARHRTDVDDPAGPADAGAPRPGRRRRAHGEPAPCTPCCGVQRRGAGCARTAGTALSTTGAVDDVVGAPPVRAPQRAGRAARVAAGRHVPAGGGIDRQPLVLGVGDEGRAVGEDHLEAGPAEHHLGGGDDARRTAVRAEQQITDADLAHRRPAGRGGQRGVERQRLPEPRPRRHDDHLARVQAVGGGVEVREAGGHAQRHAAAGGDGVDLVHRGLQQLFEGDVVLARAALGDLVDRRLGAVDDVVDLAALGAVVAELDDPGSGLDEAPQGGLLGDDLGVVRGVRGGGDGRDQRVQVGGAAEADQVAPALQLRGDRDRVGGLAAAVEVEDALVDGLVRGAVEVVGPQDLDDVRDRVLAQEHAAEHRLLGGEVLRGLPVERRQVGTRSRCVARGAHRPGTARCSIVRHGHTQRHPRSTVYRTCVRHAWGVRRFPFGEEAARATGATPCAARLGACAPGTKQACGATCGQHGDGGDDALQPVPSSLWTMWGQLPD